MAPSLTSAGIDGEPRGISAGDSSETAFQPNREARYQVGMVAEPLRRQGCQVVDEANRALAGEADMGCVAPNRMPPRDAGFVVPAS